MQITALHNNYASPLRRLVAHIIDHIVIGGILLSTLSLPHSHKFFWWYNGSISSLVLIAIGLEIVYYAATESSKYQASFGKIALGIRVESATGQRISFSKALLRNASKLILGLIAYALILFDNKNRGLHDMIAETVVVKS